MALRLWAAALAACAPLAAPGAPPPRRVRVDGQQFVLAATRAPIVMSGPNVVVKGPPYMPSVTGESVCNDVVDATCQAAGTSASTHEGR